MPDLSTIPIKMGPQAAPNPGPAGPGPSTSPARVAPTQEDRLLAAASHLAFYTGFWMVGPIAIYLIKRKESRFVAFHALQAALLHVLLVAVSVIGGIVGAVVMAVLLFTLPRGGEGLAMLVSLLPFLTIGLGSAAVMIIHLVAAYRAWQGELWSIPVAGRLAERILGADEGAKKA